eukprot:GEMP01000604.1.p1 GENE.GEMP01000604.1~~GEMP01000604.1.p1  ORF type:complete len:1512 (+),score=330.22 GEMP01000604.1:239-4774(+)
MASSRPWLAYTHRRNAPAATVVTVGDYIITAVSLSSHALSYFSVQFEVWDIRSQSQVHSALIALDLLYPPSPTLLQSSGNPSSLRFWPGALLTWHKHGFALALQDNGQLYVKSCLGFVGDVSLCMYDDEVILYGTRFLEPVRIAGYGESLSPTRKQRTKLPKQAGNLVHVDVRGSLFVCTDKGQVLAYNFSGKALTLIRTIYINDPLQKKQINKFAATYMSYPYVVGKAIDMKSFSDALKLSRRCMRDPCGFLFLFEAPTRDNACQVLHLPAPVHGVAVYRSFVLLAMAKNFVIVHKNRVIVSVEMPGIKGGFTLARNFAIVLPDLWVDIDVLVCMFECPLHQAGKVVAHGDRPSDRNSGSITEVVYFITMDDLVADSKNEPKVVFDNAQRILDIDPPRYLLSREDSTILWNSDTGERKQLPLAPMGCFLRNDIVTIASPEGLDGKTHSHHQVLQVYNEHDQYLATKELDVNIFYLICDRAREGIFGLTKSALVRLRWDSDRDSKVTIRQLWAYPSESRPVCHAWNDTVLALGFPRVVQILREDADDSFSFLFSFNVVRCYSLAAAFGKVFVTTPTGILEVPGISAHASAPPFSLEKGMGILAIKSDRVILIEEASSTRNNDEGDFCTKRRIRYRPLTLSDEHCTDLRTAWPHSKQPWKLFACLHAPPQLRHWAEPARLEDDVFRAVALRTFGLSVGEHRRLSAMQLSQNRQTLEDNLRRLVLEDRRDDIHALVAYTVQSSLLQDTPADNPVALKLVYNILRDFLLIKECSELFEWEVQPPNKQDLEAFAQCFYMEDSPLPPDALRLSVLDQWHGIAMHRASVVSLERAMSHVGVRQAPTLPDLGSLMDERLPVKDNLIIYWRCADNFGDVVVDCACMGRDGDVQDGSWGEEMTDVDTEDDWGVKKRPNHAVVLPNVESAIVYAGDENTEMDEWTIEFYVRSDQPSFHLLRIGDIWIRREGETMLGPFGQFEAKTPAVDFTKWTYIAIRHKNGSVDIATAEGIKYTAQAHGLAIPGSVPLRFGGQCQMFEIRVWNVRREWAALLEFCQRPLLQISDSQNKSAGWKKIRFLPAGSRTTFDSSDEQFILPLPPPPGESQHAVSVDGSKQPKSDVSCGSNCTSKRPSFHLNASGEDASKLRDSVASRESPSRKSPIIPGLASPPQPARITESSPIERPAINSADASPPSRFASYSQYAASLSPTAASSMERPDIASTGSSSPSRQRDSAYSDDITGSEPVAIRLEMSVNKRYPLPPSPPPGAPIRPIRIRRKAIKNPPMPQIEEEDDESQARPGKGLGSSSEAITMRKDKPGLFPVTHEAFCEMICGRFDRAELLLGALDIRGRWVYQACLKLLRREDEADQVEKAQIASMLMRLPVLRIHRTTLQKRAMAWFALAGAPKCALHVAQVLMIESNGADEICNAYRSLKAKQSSIPNLALCGTCPNCEQHMPLHPFETRCQACGCDTAFDSKQMRLISKDNAQKCKRCGFVELRPKSNECGYCGTAVHYEPVVDWY